MPVIILRVESSSLPSLIATPPSLSLACSCFPEIDEAAMLGNEKISDGRRGKKYLQLTTGLVVLCFCNGAGAGRCHECAATR
jgi:hypothetical protein